MNSNLKDVGNRVRQARKDKGLTQSQLADRIDVSESHLSAIETGKINFGVDVLYKLTDELQVSADWLLRASNPETRKINNEEFDALISDCSPEEISAIFKMAKELKVALKKAAQSSEN